MDILMNAIVFIVPVLAIVTVVILTSFNLYFKFRRKFPVRVNCWFCNTDNRVPYSNYNSWTCPNCQQYNGFKADGSYNRDIPEQRNIHLNKSVRSCYMSPKVPASNGLCHACNRNQELKIMQLASFVPLDVRNFDIEVEKHQKELDDAYKLCNKCTRVLKKAIDKSMTVLLSSKLSYLRSKGLNYINLNVSTKSMTSVEKQKFVLILIRSMLTLLAVLQLALHAHKYDLFETKIKWQVHKDLVDFTSTGVTYLKLVYVFVWSQFTFISNAAINLSNSCVSFIPDISPVYELCNVAPLFLSNFPGIGYFNYPSMPQLSIPSIAKSNDLLVGVAGCLLSLVLVYWKGDGVKETFQLLLWTLTSAMTIGEQYNYIDGEKFIYADTLKIIIAVALLFIALKRGKRGAKRKHITKSSAQGVEETNFAELSNMSDGEQCISDTEANMSNSDKSNTSCFSTSTMWLPSSKQKKTDISALNLSFSRNNSVLDESVYHKCSSPSNLFGATNIFTDHAGKSFNSVNNSAVNNPLLLNGTIGNRKTMSEHSFGRSSFNINNSFALKSDITNNMLNNLISNMSECSASDVKMSNVNQSSSKHRQNQYNYPNPIFTTRTYNGDSSSSIFKKISPTTAHNHKKPILSPSRLENTLTQSSWIAGGYWGPPRSPPVQVAFGFQPLSRTSSESSGFESQTSSQLFQGSLPSSRDSSECEFDRSSVLSEPAYYGNNYQQKARKMPHYPHRVYPALREDRPTFIRPRLSSLDVSFTDIIAPPSCSVYKQADNRNMHNYNNCPINLTNKETYRRSGKNYSINTLENLQLK